MRNVADPVCVTEIRLLPCAYFNQRDNAGEGGESLPGAAEYVSDRRAAPPGRAKSLPSLGSRNCRVIRVFLHTAELVPEVRGVRCEQNRAEHRSLCTQQHSAYFMSIIRSNHVLEPKKVCIIQICQVGVGAKLLTQAVDPFGFLRQRFKTICSHWADFPQ